MAKRGGFYVEEGEEEEEEPGNGGYEGGYFELGELAEWVVGE